MTHLDIVVLVVGYDVLPHGDHPYDGGGVHLVRTHHLRAVEHHYVAAHSAEGFMTQGLGNIP